MGGGDTEWPKIQTSQKNDKKGVQGGEEIHNYLISVVGNKLRIDKIGGARPGNAI